VKAFVRREDKNEGESRKWKRLLLSRKAGTDK
jgi:hypothetical protein